MHLNFMSHYFHHKKKLHSLFLGLGIYLLIGSCLIYLYPVKIQNDLTQNVFSYPINHSPEKEYSQIVSWHLFGINTAGLLTKVNNAHIKLVGIIYRPDIVNGSSEVVLINDKEYVLRNGDKIGRGYTIHNIEPSRVIVTSQNGLEEFTLFAHAEK